MGKSSCGLGWAMGKIRIDMWCFLYLEIAICLSAALSLGMISKERKPAAILGSNSINDHLKKEEGSLAPYYTNTKSPDRPLSPHQDTQGPAAPGIRCIPPRD
jgi:hypothetical protein